MLSRWTLPVLLTLAAQRVLGLPGLPGWAADPLLPAVWIVAAALRSRERPWPLAALLIGLGWDLVLEPVVGPGGIAWSAAALALNGLAGVVADRSPKAWAGFGATAAALVTLVHHLAVLPLGLGSSLSAAQVLRTAVFTGAWCGLVGLVSALGLPQRWRTLRARRLR